MYQQVSLEMVTRYSLFVDNEPPWLENLIELSA